MTILEKIIHDKKKEVALKKQVVPVSQLETSALFERPVHSLSQRIKTTPGGIIAEHKRRSPSKSVINQQLNVYEVASGYEKAGVSGMSVLTDGKYFGGSLEDLLLARASCKLPLLRKEFIIDEYQLIEAKAYGADAVLLIAAVLNSQQLKALSECAFALGLEVLLEVHNRKELDKALSLNVPILGINNRDLKTFKVSLETSRNLAALIPDTFIKVSESGIHSAEAIQQLKSYGFSGFLIGENFMKTEDPGKEAHTFIQQITRA
ncbi:indole-3-glycerol phosphate synthase TrpC [Ascidiimonas aurantiaca]|uniref:indole-3-glycerol phosphate synthase TrpC n=1 Tax=Ascidiimonas aurantiaca TaxID=1685432 RepID=UPI0030EBA638